MHINVVVQRPKEAYHLELARGELNGVRFIGRCAQPVSSHLMSVTRLYLLRADRPLAAPLPCPLRPLTIRAFYVEHCFSDRFV